MPDLLGLLIKKKGRVFFGICCLFLLVGGIYCHMRQIDVDKILKNSVFKDKQFSSHVQEIDAGDFSAYLLEEHSNPIVSISFLFKNSGRAYEPEGKQGLVTILTDVLKKGAGAYDAESFIDLCSEYGVNLDLSSGLDEISVDFQFPKSNQEMALNLLKAVLTAPHFEQRYLDLSKEQHTIAINLKKERIRSFTSDKFREHFFSHHAYERPSIGVADEMTSVSADDLRRFMKEKFAKDNLLIAIAGDVTQDEVFHILTSVFSELPDHAILKQLPQINIESTGKVFCEEFHAAQNYVMFASQSVYRQSEDFYPLYLANYVFGASGLESRLNKNIREKEGLTYGLYTTMNINNAAALLEGAFSVTPDNLKRSMELLKQQWLEISKGEISADELEKAKNSLVLSNNLRYASVSRISNMLLRMQEYDLGIDFLEKRNSYINNTTLQQVNDAARKYFRLLPDFVISGEQCEEKK